MNILKCTFLFLFLFIISSCKEVVLHLKPVTFSEFEAFVDETKYITDAEKYGWSIVQIDVYNFEKVDDANWRVPDGINKAVLGELPVTQVSYNDALAYCSWAKTRLPNYDEYWKVVEEDDRIIVSENKLPISEVDKVNIVGNVWDITENKNTDLVRLAGGSVYCSKYTCHGTIREKELFVDRETANIHIGFSVIELE